MKIEIGESMILSWLKHCQKCQVVQTNWKASTNTWIIYNTEKIESIAHELKEHYENTYEMDIFKKNKSIYQVIQQGEVDVLGVEICLGKIQNLYAVDVAFHEGGLNYGNVEETIARVIKKLIRTALTIMAYFDLNRANIIFAAPTINNNIVTPLQGMTEELNTLFKRYNCEFVFDLICNDRFKEQIFMPVIEVADMVADTSELFLRSIQMYNIFGNENSFNRKSVKSAVNKENIHENPENIKGQTDDIKIGKLVQQSFSEIIKKALLSEEDIKNLQDINFCKRVLKLNYPCLKEIIPEMDINEQRRDENEYSRYYARPYMIKGRAYLLCSQWYLWNKDYYISWLEAILS